MQDLWIGIWPMLKHWLNRKTWLLATLFAVSMAFAQVIETQHEHDQFTADCYVCQQSVQLACDSDPQPRLEQPERGNWHETSPYHRHLRSTEKRGKRDPPVSPAVSA